MFPLVSAVMPTYNRRPFISASISNFLAQEYPASWKVELIVLDDGTDPVRDLVPNDVRIRYFYEPKRNHGEKINRCMELSSSDLFVIFDDDDIYHNSRIRLQIEPMLSNSAIRITGTSTLYYRQYNAFVAYQYTSPKNIGWLASLAFRRGVWRPLQSGADWVLQTQVRNEYGDAALLDLHNPSLVIATVHPENACKKHVESPEYVPVPWSTIENLLCESLLLS